MARPKKAKAKKVVAPKEKKPTDPNVMEEVWEEYTFTCPKRGKITQRVKVKKLKPKGGSDTQMIADSDPAAELDTADNGLQIYTEEELEKSSNE